MEAVGASFQYQTVRTASSWSSECAMLMSRLGGMLLANWAASSQREAHGFPRLWKISKQTRTDAPEVRQLPAWPAAAPIRIGGAAAGGTQGHLRIYTRYTCARSVNYTL